LSVDIFSENEKKLIITNNRINSFYMDEHDKMVKYDEIILNGFDDIADSREQKKIINTRLKYYLCNQLKNALLCAETLKTYKLMETKIIENFLNKSYNIKNNMYKFDVESYQKYWDFNTITLNYYMNENDTKCDNNFYYNDELLLYIFGNMYCKDDVIIPNQKDFKDVLKKITMIHNFYRSSISKMKQLFDENKKERFHIINYFENNNVNFMFSDNISKEKYYAVEELVGITINEQVSENKLVCNLYTCILNGDDLQLLISKLPKKVLEKFKFNDSELLEYSCKIEKNIKFFPKKHIKDMNNIIFYMLKYNNIDSALSMIKEKKYMIVENWDLFFEVLQYCLNKKQLSYNNILQFYVGFYELVYKQYEHNIDEYNHKKHVKKLKDLLYCNYLYEDDAYNKFSKMINDISDDEKLNIEVIDNYLQ
jgi:hypothetical protein